MTKWMDNNAFQLSIADISSNSNTNTATGVNIDNGTGDSILPSSLVYSYSYLDVDDDDDPNFDVEVEIAKELASLGPISDGDDDDDDGDGDSNIESDIDILAFVEERERKNLDKEILVSDVECVDVDAESEFLAEFRAASRLREERILSIYETGLAELDELSNQHVDLIERSKSRLANNINDDCSEQVPANNFDATNNTSVDEDMKVLISLDDSDNEELAKDLAELAAKQNELEEHRKQQEEQAEVERESRKAIQEQRLREEREERERISQNQIAEEARLADYQRRCERALMVLQERHEAEIKYLEEEKTRQNEHLVELKVYLEENAGRRQREEEERVKKEEDERLLRIQKEEERLKEEKERLEEEERLRREEEILKKVRLEEARLRKEVMKKKLEEERIRKEEIERLRKEEEERLQREEMERLKQEEEERFRKEEIERLRKEEEERLQREEMERLRKEEEERLQREEMERLRKEEEERLRKEELERLRKEEEERLRREEMERLRKEEEEHLREEELDRLRKEEEELLRKEELERLRLEEEERTLKEKIEKKRREDQKMKQEEARQLAERKRREEVLLAIIFVQRRWRALAPQRASIAYANFMNSSSTKSAALQIQMWWRSRLACRLIREIRSAITIQSAIRGAFVRWRYIKLRDKRVAAALHLQALFRGYIVRRNLARVDCRFNKEWLNIRQPSLRQLKAATRIQAVFRGFSVRAHIRYILASSRYVDDDDFDYNQDVDLSGLAMQGEDDYWDSIERNAVLRPKLDPSRCGPRTADSHKNVSVSEFSSPKIRQQQQQQQFQQISFQSPNSKEKTDEAFIMPSRNAWNEINESQLPLRQVSDTIERSVSFDSNLPLSFSSHMRNSHVNNNNNNMDARRYETPSPLLSTTSSAAEKAAMREHKRIEKVSEEWGLKESRTAEAMYRKQMRYKKLMGQATRRKKQQDPMERLRVFKHAYNNPTKSVNYPDRKGPAREHYFSELRRTQKNAMSAHVRHQEDQDMLPKRPQVFAWVHDTKTAQNHSTDVSDERNDHQYVTPKDNVVESPNHRSRKRRSSQGKITCLWNDDRLSSNVNDIHSHEGNSPTLSSSSNVYELPSVYPRYRPTSSTSGGDTESRVSSASIPRLPLISSNGGLMCNKRQTPPSSRSSNHSL